MNELVPLYRPDHVAHHCKPSTAKANWHLFDRFILPAYGALPVENFGREDIASLRRALGDRPCQAGRVLEIAVKLFNLADEWKLRTAGNPCRFVRKCPEQRRERFLNPNRSKRTNWSVACQAMSLLRSIFRQHCIDPDGPCNPVDLWLAGGGKFHRKTRRKISAPAEVRPCCEQASRPSSTTRRAVTPSGSGSTSNAATVRCQRMIAARAWLNGRKITFLSGLHQTGRDRRCFRHGYTKAHATGLKPPHRSMTVARQGLARLAAAV